MKQILHAINERRHQLGMSHAALAELTGVSLPTIQRALSGNAPNVSFSVIHTICKTLGVGLEATPLRSEKEMVRSRAKEKAQWLASVVLGTSALEAQGLKRADAEEIYERFYHTLMSGPRSTLWNG